MVKRFAANTNLYTIIWVFMTFYDIINLLTIPKNTCCECY